MKKTKSKIAISKPARPRKSHLRLASVEAFAESEASVSGDDSEQAQAPKPVDAGADPALIEKFRQHAQKQFGQLATQFAELFPGIILAGVLEPVFRDTFHAGAYKIYMDNLLCALGNPIDADEIMLAQQVIWGHHLVGNLVVKAAQAKTLQDVEIYNKALAQAMAECRRSILALRALRTTLTVKTLPHVEQPIVATRVRSGGDASREKHPRQRSGK